MAIKDSIADDYMDSRRSKRNIREIREQGREDRRNKAFESNLSLRNKVADAMLDDEETRRAIIEGAKDTASFAQNALKWLGISLLISGGVFATYKVVQMVMGNKNQQDELDSQTKNLDKNNLTYPEDDYKLMANSLYTYFEPTAWYEFSQSIDKDSIIKTLKKMKTKDDWAFLLKCFGTRHDGPTDSYLTLIEFMRKDDPSDRADYQKELDRIQAYNVLN